MNKEQNLFRYGIEKPNKFDRLREDWIVGIITNQGVVVSQQHYYEDAPTHEDLWPLVRCKRWRWDFDKGVNFSVYGNQDFEVGDSDLIKDHLRREYGIRFMSNGYHDIDYFISKLTKNK